MKLYQEICNNVKPTTNGWHIASCPNPEHDDRNPSFTFHRDGNCKCLGNCDFKGTEYDIAKKLGRDDAMQFLRDSSGNYIDNKEPNSSFKEQTTVEKAYDLQKLAKQFKEHLKANMEYFPSYWNKKVIDIGLVGLTNDKKFTFNEFDKYKNLINVRIHKGKQFGLAENRKNKWLHLHHILGYEKNKPWIWCEGHPDYITLLSQRFNCVTTSCGSMNIPKKDDGSLDLDIFKNCKKIILFGDNDKAGDTGCENAYKELFKFHIVKIW